jgi:hypothetical protein
MGKKRQKRDHTVVVEAITDINNHKWTSKCGKFSRRVQAKAGDFIAVDPDHAKILSVEKLARQSNGNPADRGGRRRRR